MGVSVAGVETVGLAGFASGTSEGSLCARSDLVETRAMSVPVNANSTRFIRIVSRRPGSQKEIAIRRASKGLRFCRSWIRYGSSDDWRVRRTQLPIGADGETDQTSRGG